MTYTFVPKGVCARKITFDIEGDVVKNVRFAGGCAGNTQGVSALVEGMTIQEVIGRLSGIRCGFKGTSCPDQLAKAIVEAAK